MLDEKKIIEEFEVLEALEGADGLPFHLQHEDAIDWFVARLRERHPEITDPDDLEGLWCIVATNC